MVLRKMFNHLQRLKVRYLSDGVFSAPADGDQTLAQRQEAEAVRQLRGVVLQYVNNQHKYPPMYRDVTLKSSPEELVRFAYSLELADQIPPPLLHFFNRPEHRNAQRVAVGGGRTGGAVRRPHLSVVRGVDDAPHQR